ncbi:MAG: hypothetical protein IAF38_20405, partial [Bacteroidia bacterium]|nr:hypothetical protein [Bacteroidia bacterium]
MKKIIFCFLWLLIFSAKINCQTKIYAKLKSAQAAFQIRFLLPDTRNNYISRIYAGALELHFDSMRQIVSFNYFKNSVDYQENSSTENNPGLLMQGHLKNGKLIGRTDTWYSKAKMHKYFNCREKGNEVFFAMPNIGFPYYDGTELGFYGAQPDTIFYCRQIKGQKDSVLFEVYTNGKLQGKWSKFSENGDTLIVAEYLDNYLDGIKQEFVDGKLISQKSYKNGWPDGKYEIWFANGTKKEEGTIKN